MERFWLCDRPRFCRLLIHSKRITLLHNPIIKIVNPLCVAEVAHIFFAAIRAVYNLVSDLAVMLKALEIFDPALHPI